MSIRAEMNKPPTARRTSCRARVSFSPVLRCSAHQAVRPVLRRRPDLRLREALARTPDLPLPRRVRDLVHRCTGGVGPSLPTMHPAISSSDTSWNCWRIAHGVMNSCPRSVMQADHSFAAVVMRVSAFTRGSKSSITCQPRVVIPSSEVDLSASTTHSSAAFDHSFCAWMDNADMIEAFGSSPSADGAGALGPESARRPSPNSVANSSRLADTR